MSPQNAQVDKGVEPLRHGWNIQAIHREYLQLLWQHTEVREVKTAKVKPPQTLGEIDKVLCWDTRTVDDVHLPEGRRQRGQVAQHG